MGRTDSDFSASWKRLEKEYFGEIFNGAVHEPFAHWLVRRITSLEDANENIKAEIDEFHRNQPFTEALIHDINQEITRRNLAESALPPDGLFRFEEE